MKKIDWSKKLSDDDRTWALQFDHLRTQVEQNDQKFGRKDTSQADNRAARMSELESLIAEHTNELARLRQEQADEENENRLRAGAVNEGRFVTDATHVNGEEPKGAVPAAETYEGWSQDKLKAEIRKRNKEREAEDLDPLPTSGTKAELVERLLADDREIAESQAQ